MQNKIAITVAILAYNEEKNLEATVQNVLRAKEQVGNLPIEIILINDGSTDRTPQICDGFAVQYNFIKVIHHPANSGIGVSIKDSIKLARGEKWAVFPGDNDIPLEAIVTLFENHDKADMVMQYFINCEMRGRKRNILSIIFNTIYLVSFNVYVQYLNGPGTFPTRVLRDMDIFSTRFSVIAEMRVKLLRQGFSYYELPTNMQTGAELSSALSLKNLKEVILTFCYLIFEIYFVNRNKYCKRPVRFLQ